MKPRDWDGATYDRISAPLQRIGVEVLDRLELRGDETVLDAGCGSGRVTEALVERLPDGHVIGVDGSPGMIAAARERLGDRAELLVSDLLELDLGGREVDAILSTATFHWIADHDALFARLRGVLRPGGRLVAQCGGAGNLPALTGALAELTGQPPFAEHLAAGPPLTWDFPAPDETEARLRRAGFREARAWLVERPPPYEEDDLREWLRTNALGSHLERLPEELREPFVDAVEARLVEGAPNPYVRLNLDALL